MLFVGDDWAEDHHDVEIQNAAGKRLAAARLPEGLAGVARLHELVAAHLPDSDSGSDSEGEAVAQVWVGIETERGPWVQALVAAGYRVFAINPRQVARYRERHSNAGAKSDAGDAHSLADMVRTDGHQLRPIAGDTELAAGIKVLSRAHQRLIRDRTRQVLRLRQSLLEYFPAALDAFDDLTRPDTVELLGKAPDPDTAARLTRAQIGAAMRRARRPGIEAKTATMAAALRRSCLTRSEPVTAAFAAATRSLAGVIAALNSEIATLQRQLSAEFERHPAAAIYRSQPGLGPIVAARVLAEFGDDPGRYASARSRKNYAATSPITRQSGKKKSVHARYVHNERLVDALGRQAQGALVGSAGARAYYDLQRARGLGHRAALRQLANRLVGILHGCLKTGALYDETTAWGHRSTEPTPPDAADAA
ncbi:IS110 family transposase [Pseudonocardia sp. KRD291]|uniref:IS110 family transposase n=1 Tax=Pseudonocardia sp. KRD291 TaxID=2792007 RepID=UPI001C4A1167|nr:IS110 family transposase [Pseudonocardia sp. KRD291]MBW0104305.1 IS110 family transposase [Pseudonocardia sp. KRD291]